MLYVDICYCCICWHKILLLNTLLYFSIILIPFIANCNADSHDHHNCMIFPTVCLSVCLRVRYYRLLLPSPYICMNYVVSVCCKLENFAINTPTHIQTYIHKCVCIYCMNTIEIMCIRGQ